MEKKAKKGRMIWGGKGRSAGNEESYKGQIGQKEREMKRNLGIQGGKEEREVKEKGK